MFKPWDHVPGSALVRITMTKGDDKEESRRRSHDPAQSSPEPLSASVGSEWLHCRAVIITYGGCLV
jgi:hypothetical protein